MKAYCGADCSECEKYEKECVGCRESDGKPFGKECFIARYIKIGGMDELNKMKKELIDEINSFHIEGMPTIEELFPLNGEMINLEYNLPNQEKVKFLNDQESYFGTQVESIFNTDESKKCFGIACNMNFILICEYGENGTNPELILF